MSTYAVTISGHTKIDKSI